jgi:hypothetical protein
MKTRISGAISTTMPGGTSIGFSSGCDDYNTRPVDMPRRLGKMEHFPALREPRGD